MATCAVQRQAASLVALVCLSTAVACAALTSPTLAQQWTQLPAPGGWIKRLAVAPNDPSIVYAGAFEGGLFLSTDSGATWSRTAVAEIGRDTVGALAFDPTIDAVVYAGTETSGVFKTIDGGAHWAAINTGIPAPSSRLMSIRAIAVDPGNVAVVLAGGRTFSSTGAADLLLSTNAGQSWAPVTAPGLADVAINYLAIAGASAFAATEGQGVWWSSDNERTWGHLGGAAIDSISVNSVIVDQSTSPLRVIATTDDGVWAIDLAVPSPPTAAHVRSAGTSAYDWESYRAEIIAIYWSFGAIAYDPPEPTPTPAAWISTAFTNPVYLAGTVTDGVFRNADRGATPWKQVSTGLAPVDVESLAVAAANSHLLFAGADGAGVWHSADGGESWNWASRGLLAPTLDAIAVDPTDPATVWAGSEGGGVLKSSDGGVTWAMTGFNTLVYDKFDPFVRSLTIDPNATSTVYVVTDQGVFQTSTGGSSWTRLTLPRGFYPRTIVATGGATTTLWLGGTPGVLSSTNGGVSWSSSDPTFTQTVLSLAASHSTPQTLYAGCDGGGVYKTTNQGTSWGAVNNDGGTGFLKYGRVPALAVDPTSADIAYACVDGRAVWKTTNGGASWSNLPNGLYDEVNVAYASLSAIVIDPVHPASVFAGATGAAAFGGSFLGAYRSDDSGAHWQPLGSGLEGLSVTSLALDPTNSDRLYAGAQGAGLFRYGPAATRPLVPRRALHPVH